MFPNKVLQKVSTAEILQNARVGTAVHCLPEWQAPVWVLTGFACYSARKSRSCHAGFRKCSYTCCACYSPFPMLASAGRRYIYIEYDLVGYIPVDELLKAEQA